MVETALAGPGQRERTLGTAGAVAAAGRAVNFLPLPPCLAGGGGVVAGANGAASSGAVSGSMSASGLPAESEAGMDLAATAVSEAWAPAEVLATGARSAGEEVFFLTALEASALLTFGTATCTPNHQSSATATCKQHCACTRAHHKSWTYCRCVRICTKDGMTKRLRLTV